MTEIDREAHDTPAVGHSDVARGRRPSTNRTEVGRAALVLFSRQGYDETTVDDIAASVGISRRTFFRYFETKGDAVWGAFDEELARFSDHLAQVDPAVPLMDALRHVVVETNRFGPDELDELRLRMSLIRSVPSLVAHSAVRYAEWCDVVARFAASRLGEDPSGLGPQTVARATLGAAQASFESWARQEDADLPAEFDRAFRLLASGFSLEPPD